VAACTNPPVASERDGTSDTAHLPLKSDAAAQAETSRAFDFRGLEASIRTEIEAGKIPSAAFAIARNGVVIYENALGWADKEQQIASTVHTPYALASATKPIVATALMILQERGRVELQVPARHYAGSWFSPRPSDRTHPDFNLRQLLNHTSGLGTYARIYWRDQDRPVQSLVDSFRKYGFVAQPPGAISEYSNLAYGLIGHIIEEQSGTSLTSFLKTEIFRPLAMHNSMLVDSFSSSTKAAKKYSVSGAPLVETYNDTPGAGNVYASAHDLALFGAFQLDGNADHSQPILGQQSKRLMRSFVEPGARFPYYNSSYYGLGWYFRESADGETVVWHEGGMPGASAIIILLPQRNIVATVVINSTDANAYAQTFANALIQAVEPDVHPTSFNPTEGFNRFTDQPEFLGRWEGSIRVDQTDVPWVLNFEADGSVRAEFPQRAVGSLLPAQVAFPALVNGDLLVATFAATLPASDVSQTPNGYVLLRLVRRADQLSGTAIAYASAHRLEHLYPFAVHLRRKAE
jgi:CubicO group peptidase (beta-lactamase class C family)